jgi:purine-nucleoside phosphorylase
MIYDRAIEAKDYILSKYAYQIESALILGSGLSDLVNDLENLITIDFHEIPYFKSASVKGHKNKLLIGVLNGKHVLVMTGRLHFYEGYTMAEITFPIYVFKLLGIKNLILTNSCGGINQRLLSPGDVMVINDFINLMPSNPLIGINDERFGPRFPDMTEPFDQDLRELAKNTISATSLNYKEGVYAGFMGPYYETKAEIEMIKRMGADAVGMSTVPEVIVSNYLGLRTIAFATITNMATGIQRTKHSHEHVIEMARKTSFELRLWIKALISKI